MYDTYIMILKLILARCRRKSLTFFRTIFCKKVCLCPAHDDGNFILCENHLSGWLLTICRILCSIYQHTHDFLSWDNKFNSHYSKNIKFAILSLRSLSSTVFHLRSFIKLCLFFLLQCTEIFQYFIYFAFGTTQAAHIIQELIRYIT